MPNYIYVAGPYEIPPLGMSRRDNATRAIQAAEALSKLDYVPIVPHLSHYWEAQYHHSRDFWLERGINLLQLCNCLVRLPGESAGCEDEVQFALDKHMPVYFGLDHVPCAQCNTVGYHSLMCKVK